MELNLQCNNLIYKKYLAYYAERQPIRAIRFLVKYILGIQDRKFVSGIDDCLPRIEASFLICYCNSNLRVRSQDLSFDFQSQLIFRNQSIDPGHKTSNLNCNNKLKKKLRFWKQTFDPRNEGHIYKKRMGLMFFNCKVTTRMCQRKTDFLNNSAKCVKESNKYFFFFLHQRVKINSSLFR